MTLKKHHSILVRCLQDCATQSEHCATVATGLIGKRQCISLCHDTAALCRLGAELLARESELTSWLLPACELACLACADECEKHIGSFFGECARQCRSLSSVMDRAQSVSGISTSARA